MTQTRFAALAAFLLFAPLLRAQTTRPNFLFILTDDQRYDAIGLVQREQGEKSRFPWFKTPNLDRLAGQGLRFTNAFVTNSLCAPSRACFLTGQYNHLNGVPNNHTPFPESNITHATELKKAGYITAYFGKWHHGNQKERPGFDEIASFIGQGKYEDCPMNINGTITPTTGWVDDVTTDHAIAFLEKRASASDNKPFDMVIGFKSPHDPRHPPERAKDRFAGESPRPVPNLDEQPPYRVAPPTTRNRPGRGGEGMLNYFRCISAIDDDLGRILDTLDKLKLADNTVVVFASDNGYFFGEHSLGDKRAAYEESLRIVTIVRYPRLIKPNTTSDAMVLNIDYAPTILDLAAVGVPDSMQGKSWKPLFASNSAPFRDQFLFEYFFEKGFATPTIVGVRTADAKLITYPKHDDWTELFNLQADPFEMKNLIGDASSADLLKRMQTSLQQEITATKFAIPANSDPAR